MPHFRSLRSTSQIARDQAHAYALLAADVTVALERYVEFPERDVPSYPVSIDDPYSLAQVTSCDMTLSGEPVHAADPGRLDEHRGIPTVFSPGETAPIDADHLHTPKRPVILLNPSSKTTTARDTTPPTNSAT